MAEKNYMKYYFAYGSNMDLLRMLSRCPEAQIYMAGELSGYKLTFIKNSSGKGVANIIKDPESYVEGAIYKVSLKDLLALDRFEGHPTVYRRETVTINTGYSEIEAITYIMTSTYKTETLPSDEYLNYLLTGCGHWGIRKERVLSAVNDLFEKRNEARSAAKNQKINTTKNNDKASFRHKNEKDDLPVYIIDDTTYNVTEDIEGIGIDKDDEYSIQKFFGKKIQIGSR